MEALDGILKLDEREGVYIDIGTKVYLEIEGIDFSVSSIFIGMLRDEFMVITLPKRYNSIRHKLLPSNKIIIKYLFKGLTYAFQSSVIELTTTPVRTLTIEYPKVVQQRELRVANRSAVVIPGRVVAKKTDFNVVINDFSEKGCNFKYFHDQSNIIPLKKGDRFRIYCHFPGVAEEIGAMACVRNVRREQGEISIGAELQDVTKDFLTPLMNFLHSILTVTM
nr:flagellar brake protein [uncultured Desulfobacter sp.]